MATVFDTPVTPFAGPFADIPNQFLDASTRAISASAELYTEVLSSQAAATRAVLEAYASLGGQAVQAGAETTERVEETTTRVARSTGRAAQRTTRRAATATRKAAKPVKATAKATAKVEPPITGYDDLTADEIVAKLPEQPQATLAAVAAYERANEKRSTVLQRVAALSGPEPAPGYDELNADDAQKLVTSGSATLAAAVRDYERRHKNRASVIEAAARNADTNAS
jgi:hypothetical protein